MLYSSLGNPVIYWILRFITFFTLLICGYHISYKDTTGKKYWYFSLFATIVYSLNYGLRWNRSFDYPHYYDDLTSNILYTDYDEPLYLAWLSVFKFTGLPYWVAFIFYSFILIFGFLLILKRYPKAAVWALPLFFTLPSNVDNFVRQYFATAFLFIGFYFVQDKKIKKCIFFFICAAMIHLSALFAILFVLFFYYIPMSRIIKNPWVIIIFYVGLYFIWDVSYFDKISSVLSGFDIGENRMQSYLDNADQWFSSEGDINSKLGIVGVGAFSKISSIIGMFISVGVMYYGYKLFHYGKSLEVIYWLSVCALFIKIIGGSIEIYSRFYCWLICFEPILIGMIFACIKMQQKMRLLAIGLCIFYYYGIGFVWGITKLNMTGYAFIWDR